MRERRALVVFLLLAGVFVAGLLLAERRESAVSADRVEAEMEATVAADSVRLFEFDPNTVEYADLRRLGLTSRMAVSLLKYRAAAKCSDPRGCGYLLRHDRFGLFYSGTLYSDRARVCADTFSASGISGVSPAEAEEDRAPRTIQDRYGVRILPRVARFFRPSPRPLSVIGIFTKVFGTKRVFGLAI